MQRAGERRGEPAGRARAPGAWPRVAAVGLALATALGGCSASLTQDGKVVFAEGKRGASVITANGVEFLDRADVPRPVVRRSAFDAWRAPTGFLLPADGVWRETSKPVPIQGHGLGVVLRSSDALAPSWGGEILVRIDAVAPAAAFPKAAASVRAPRRLAIVLDGHGANATALASDAIEGLGERDRVMLIESAPARMVVPALPGSHRTLLEAAADRIAAQPAGARDLAGALALARGWIAAAPKVAAPPAPIAPPVRQVLVLTDGAGVRGAEERVAREVAALAGAHVRVTAVAAADALDAEVLAPLGDEVFAGGTFEEREDAVGQAVPPPGDVVLKDVTLTIASAPAPARVIEVSAGTSALSLEADRVMLGDLAAGEARTEVARIAVPAWVPNEPLEVSVTASYRDAATGEPLTAGARLAARYSNDVEAIASSRHGDVIAYASALAMVRRLDRAFAGSTVDQLGGLRPLVAWQAQSIGQMGRAQHDPALEAQAEVLTTLLAALQP
jgi:hypothetical protein